MTGLEVFVVAAVAVAWLRISILEVKVRRLQKKDYSNPVYR